jgi:hypothetical protein
LKFAFGAKIPAILTYLKLPQGREFPLDSFAKREFPLDSFASVDRLTYHVRPLKRTQAQFAHHVGDHANTHAGARGR